MELEKELSQEDKIWNLAAQVGDYMADVGELINFLKKTTDELERIWTQVHGDAPNNLLETARYVVNHQTKKHNPVIYP